MDASTPFKWLDMLEQEFDRSYAFIDVMLDEAEFEDSYAADDSNSLSQIRQRFSYIAGAFGQLVHKAQTIVQSNIKLEARVLSAEEDAARAEARCQSLSAEVRQLRAQLAAATTQNLQKSVLVEQQDLDSDCVKVLEQDSQKRMLTVFRAQLAIAQHERLKAENQQLKEQALAGHSEMEALRLTLKYLDKERAGRIQQIQLLSNTKMTADERNRVWAQLESEIALQRCKTVVRTCMARQQTKSLSQSNHDKKILNDSSCESELALPEPAIGENRVIKYQRPPENETLGLCIVGGRDVALPIIVSSIANGSPLSGQLFIGDLIRTANGVDLSLLTRLEAADVIMGKSCDSNDLEMIAYYLGGADDSNYDDELISSGSLTSPRLVEKDNNVENDTDTTPLVQFETVWLQDGELWPPLYSGFDVNQKNKILQSIETPDSIKPPPPPVLLDNSSSPINENALQASMSSSAMTKLMLSRGYRNGSSSAPSGGGAVVTLKTNIQPREEESGEPWKTPIFDLPNDGNELPSLDNATDDIAFSADV